MLVAVVTQIAQLQAVVPPAVTGSSEKKLNHVMMALRMLVAVAMLTARVSAQDRPVVMVKRAPN